MYVDLLEDKQWELSNRQWVVDIYQAVNPWLIEKYPIGQARRMSIIKSTQSGISTMAIVKCLHFLTNWNARAMYTLPRLADTQDFTTTRLDPILTNSEYLKSKLGSPNSMHAKKIGNSYIYIAEMSVEARMLPIDSLYVDEVDLSNMDNISTVINRMDASRWKLSTFLSTPTIANFGIHSLYQDSDMREWLVKCPSCNTEQPLEWDNNLRITGPANKPTKVFFGCMSCNTELTEEVISQGRWVPSRPDASSDHIGFHVSQMMTTPADVLYKIFRDPQTKLVEFYRKRLGMPYEVGGGSLERDDILVACFDEPYEPEPAWDGRSTYYLGADQGNEIQVVVCKIEKDSRRKKVVHVEMIPMAKGFSRLEQLMNVYHVRRGVGDANPNRHGMVALMEKFPGRFLVADYAEQRETWKARKSNGKNHLTNVAINRTSGLDGLMESIREGEWSFPGTPPRLPVETELLIDQVTAVKRDQEMRRTQSGEVQVAVWRKLRADHLAHSMLYMKTAIDIDKGKTSRVAVVNLEDDNVMPEVAEAPALDTDILVGITALLAEVPKEQLGKYLEKHAEGEQYDLPFPLSYKLGLAIEKYRHDDILAVMGQLLVVRKGGRKPLTL
jgi:hypothetical protein